MPREVKTIHVPPSYVEAALGSIDEKARTVELVFSTGATFARMDWGTGRPYNFRFSLKPGHVRLGRLNNGAPLLNAHSAYDLSKQVGVVVDGSAKVDGKSGRCVVRFSRRAEVEPIWQDVKDRIIRNVSVGATVHKYEEKRGSDDEAPLRTAVDWEPFEVSMVPIGADDGAKVKAGGKGAMNPCVVVEASEPPSLPARVIGRTRQLAAAVASCVPRIDVAAIYGARNGQQQEPTPPAGPPHPAAPRSHEQRTTHAKAVLTMCRDAGCLELAEPLIEQEAPVAEVRQQIERAVDIKSACSTAGFDPAEYPVIAAGYIDSTMTPADVQAHLDLLDAKLRELHPPSPEEEEARAGLSYAAIYSARNAAFERARQARSDVATNRYLAYHGPDAR